MTDTQRAQLAAMAGHVTAAVTATKAAETIAFSSDMLPVTDEVRGFIARAAMYLGMALQGIGEQPGEKVQP